MSIKAVPTEYSAYDYELKFIIKTENEEIDLSRELTSIQISLSTMDIIPKVVATLTMETSLLYKIVDKMWKSTLSIYHKRGTDRKEPDAFIMNFELISPKLSQTFPIQPSANIKQARHDYTTVTLSMIDEKTSKLLKTYVSGIYDYELLKEKTKLKKVICDIFKQANKKGMEFVFHNPTNDRVYEQISVPKTWFLNAILNLHQSYGIYDSAPLMYSDGFTFYLVNLKNRAKVNISDIAQECSKKDDPERSGYKKVSPSGVDKAVLIHTSTKESPEDVLKDNITSAVYRIYTPIHAVGLLYDQRFLIPKKYHVISEYEKYLYKYSEVDIKDLLNVDRLLPAGYNHILKSEYEAADDLIFTMNREDDINYSKGMIQQSLFNATTLLITVPPPIILKHFKPGFTYRFLPTTEHYERLDGRYLCTAVVYKFDRKGTSWRAGLDLFLSTASIID